jgi:hypothetical protein
MIICPQCSSQNRPTDKFCNSCGTPIGHLASAAGAPPLGPGTSPPPAGTYGAPPPPAQSLYAPPPPIYGAPGGPQAQSPPPIDQVQIAPPPPGFGGSPFGPPHVPAATPGYGAPPPAPAGFPPGPQQGFAPPPFGGPPAAGPGFGGYGSHVPPSPPAGYGNAPSPPEAYGAPPPQPYPAAHSPSPSAFPHRPSNPYAAGAQPQPPAYADRPQGPGALAPYAQPAPSFAPPPQQPQPPFPIYGAQRGGFASPGAIASADTTPDQAPADALRGFLVAFQSNAKGEFWPLRGGRIAVGRADSGETMDIFLRDPTISSRHAVLFVDVTSGTVIVEDTGSTNGTYVNEEHLGFNGRRELRDGDRLRLGGFTTIVKVIARV